MSQFVNNPDHKFQFDTLALHVGQEEADPASDSRAVPIYQTTSYVFRNSQHAADRFGLTGRGYLRPGYHADVTVFDPRTAAPGPDPAGRPVGICHVFVNGEHAVKDGAALGLRAGQVLAL